MTVVLQSMGTDLSDVTIKGDGCPIVESSSVCSLVMDVHARMGRGDDDDDRMMRGLRETGLRVFGRRAVVERVAMHARRVCG